MRPDVDLVILASLDSDLVPAIDEVLSQRTAMIETCSWFVPGDNAYELRSSDRTQWIWNTRLTETNVLNCQDRNEHN